MPTVFHAWLCDRFIEIRAPAREINFKDRIITPIFFGGSFSNKENGRNLIQF